MHNYDPSFFDFQRLLKIIRLQNDEDKEFVEELNKIPSDAKVEDMPFYKEYFSCFNMEQSFNGFNLAAQDKEDFTLDKDTLYLLFQFICASFSSTYELLYDKDTHSIDFSITVESGDNMVTKNIKELSDIQIKRLFIIYLEEQLKMDILSKDDEDEKEFISLEQQKNVREFEKKMNSIQNSLNNVKTTCELDELLHSKKEAPAMKASDMPSEDIFTASQIQTDISMLRSLIFADFDIPVDKALKYLRDIEENPDKTPDYKKLLSKNLNQAIRSYEGKEANEKIETALARMEQWESAIGPVSLPELVSMGKRWNISIDKLYSGKITPEVIKQMLDIFLLGQENYKIQLATTFYTYLMKKNLPGDLPKSNLLVMGPSGSDKTYGMQVLSKLFHVPFAIIHCNNLVQEGIIGSSLTDPFSSLLEKWTAEELEHTIVCFDEFDKLFQKNRAGNDAGYYNARIVNEMLNIIDDKGEVVCQKSKGKREYENISIPSDKMMFVFTGVFDGLLDQKDEKTSSIGFIRKETTAKKADRLITSEDFIQYGIKPEIMGRIQNYTVINELTEDELVQLFNMGSNSPFAEYEQYFAYNNISTVLTEEGKRALAKIASLQKLGVRGLKSLLQKVLSEDMFDLEVGEDNVLRITEQYIIDNLKE